MSGAVEKACFKCGQVKKLCEFYKHPRMSDGHLNKCKECAKSDVRGNRDDRIEHYREYDRERFKTDPRRQETHKRCRLNYNRESAHKKAAHRKAWRALHAGKLQRKPCQECGNENSEMHHPDYAKPLDVMWLCKLCHETWHRIHGDA